MAEEGGVGVEGGAGVVARVDHGFPTPAAVACRAEGGGRALAVARVERGAPTVASGGGGGPADGQVAGGGVVGEDPTMVGELVAEAGASTGGGGGDTWSSFKGALNRTVR